jgi:hypothetical protein
MGKEINRRKDCRLRQRYRLIRNDKDIYLGEGWVMAKNDRCWTRKPSRGQNIRQK